MPTISDRRLKAIDDKLTGLTYTLVDLQNQLLDHHRHLRIILTNQEKIMSKISDYAAAVNQSFSAISSGLDGLSTDLQTLNDKIAELQNSSGSISAEDQALLDDIQTHAKSLADRVAELDARTEAPAEPQG